MESNGCSYPPSFPPMLSPERGLPDHGDGFEDYYSLGPLNEEPESARPSTSTFCTRKLRDKKRSHSNDSSTKTRSRSPSRTCTRSQSRNCSRSRRRNRSRSHNRSQSLSQDRSQNRGRNHSRSSHGSRSLSHNRSPSRNRSRSLSCNHSRSLSCNHSQSLSRNRSRSFSCNRNRSRSVSRNRTCTRNRSRSLSPNPSGRLSCDRSRCHNRSRSRDRSRSHSHSRSLSRCNLGRNYREPSFSDAFRVLYLTPNKSRKSTTKYLATIKQQDQIQEVLKSDGLGSKKWLFYPRPQKPWKTRSEPEEVAAVRDNCDQRIKVDAIFFRKYKRRSKVNADAPIAKLKRWELIFYKKLGFIQAV